MELRMEQRAQTIDRDEVFELTPKAARVEKLRAQFRAAGKNEAKSFDEAFAIADREFTPDGLLPRRGVTSLDSVRIEQTGQVQL